MKNKMIIAVLVLIVAGLVYQFGFRQKKTTQEENQNIGIANPAAVYCKEQGGKEETKTFASGQKGFCVFTDKSVCDEWDFYRGDCKPGQLKVEVLKEGTGKLADVDNTVVVNYTGTLTNGTKFDSSLDRNQPFSFTLGKGQVILGWEQGILGMQVGEKAKLTIAPELAYGAAGAGAIPPNATLIFEVDLLEIR